MNNTCNKAPTDNPLVSVIMNCFNGERYLNDAISSVLSQSYPNLEIIFWDNQSTDRSAEICKSYRDPRLKYYYASEHTPLYEARNYALHHATGVFVAFLDVDDWWLPSKIESQIELFSDDGVGFVCSDYLVSSRGRLWRAFDSRKPVGSVLNDLLKDYYVGLLTLMVRRSALLELSPPFDPNFHIIGDFDFVIRLATRWKMGLCQEPLAVNRIHGANESLKHRPTQVEEMDYWLAKNMSNPPVGTSVNFKFVMRRNLYLKAVICLLSGDRIQVLGSLLKMPFGIRSIRLLGAVFLPSRVVRWLIN